MSDISKAEEYLIKRLEMLSDEKLLLMTKINKLNIEIQEIDAMIKHVAQDVDNAFEIFSPRQKKNDFAKQEIDKLLEKKEEHKSLVEELSSKCKELEDDISQLKEALGQSDEDDLMEDDCSSDEQIAYEDNTYGMKILEQQENDRSRIARDLHDSVVQVLTNLVHKCEICSKIIDVDAIRAKLELEIMSKNLRDTISEMRNIIYDLRPMSFDDLGLKITLESFLNEVKNNTNMEVTFNIEGDTNSLPSIIQLTIFRIIQESTNNSIKHSKGEHLNIYLSYVDNNVCIKVSDDGVGIAKDGEENQTGDKTGFGLDMMKERVAILNGKLEILANEGQGTIVEVNIPFLHETV